MSHSPPTFGLSGQEKNDHYMNEKQIHVDGNDHVPCGAGTELANSG